MKRTFTVILWGAGVDTIMADEIESRVGEEVRDIFDCCELVAADVTVTEVLP